jgi:pyruvate-ferredoxin/flavodoxin oxidoreductase
MLSWKMTFPVKVRSRSVCNGQHCVPHEPGSAPLSTIKDLQSKGGVGGAAGTICTAFTASQGILLMSRNILKTAGELLMTVFHVAARPCAAQGLLTQGDEADILHVKNTGFAFISSSTVQQCQNMTTISSQIQLMHFFDGLCLSHEINAIHHLSDENMWQLMPFSSLEEIRRRGPNSAHQKKSEFSEFVRIHSPVTSFVLPPAETVDHHYGEPACVVHRELPQCPQKAPYCN